MTMPRKPATVPKSMIVRRLEQIPSGTTVWSHPRALSVTADTLELYIDMEFETDDGLDYSTLPPDTPMIQVTPLNDKTVAVDLYGDWPFRPVESLPFGATDDLRVVSRFTHHPEPPEQTRSRRGKGWRR